MFKKCLATVEKHYEALYLGKAYIYRDPDSSLLPETGEYDDGDDGKSWQGWGKIRTGTVSQNIWVSYLACASSYNIT